MSHLSKEEVQGFVDDLLEELPLRELVAFANMDQIGMEVLQEAAKRYVYQEIGETEDFQKIIEALWKRVKETHRLKMVK